MVSLKWAPTPSNIVKPQHTLFSNTTNWKSAWEDNYQLDKKKLEEMLKGHLDIFVYTSLFVGTPVNWQCDPTTNIRAPFKYGKKINYYDSSKVGNIKVLWELGRQQHLVPLAVAYLVSGDERYKHEISEQIDNWIDTNPYGIGIHWCTALEAALRVISWAVTHSLLALRDGQLGLFAAVKNKTALGHAIYQHAFFIRGFLSMHSSANNHLIGELAGLLTVTTVFDLGIDGRRWNMESRRLLEREAQLQVYNDGVSKEQSFYYHLWVLEYLLLTWLIGTKNNTPFSDNYRDRILIMAQFLRDVSAPDGAPPLIGDSDDGFVVRFSAKWPENPYTEILTAVGLIFERPYFCKEPIPEKAFWYLMLSGKTLCLQKEDRKEPGTIDYPRIYPYGGYAILHAGPAHIIFDAGPLGYPSIAAHGHADALSFCVALKNQWWLIDPGTFAYHENIHWRNYFKGTSAHNTLLIDESDQSVNAGPFLWLKHANAIITNVNKLDNGDQQVSAFHDGYKVRGVIHHRKLKLNSFGDIINIFDRVIGKGSHKITCHLHFSPHVHITSGKDANEWLCTMENTNTQLKILVDSKLEWELIFGNKETTAGWYSRTLGHKQPIFTLRGSWQGILPIKIRTDLLIST